MATGWYSKTIIDQIRIGNPDPVDPSIVGAAFGEEEIPANAETDIIVVTVPVDRYYVLLGGSGSSGTDTIFRLYVNGDIKEIMRNAWTERNVQFHAAGDFAAGSIIKITAQHHSTIPHFVNASLYGTLYSNP